MGLLVLLGILVLDFALMIIIYNQNESEENTSGDVSSDTELTDSRSAESAVDPPSADTKNVSLGKEQVIKTVYRYNPSIYGAIMNGKWICRTCETENENKNLYCLLCGEKKGTYRKHTSDNSYSEVFHGSKNDETAELRDENTAVFHIS